MRSGWVPLTAPAPTHPWPAPCGMQQNENSMSITPQLGAGPKPGVGTLQGPQAEGKQEGNACMCGLGASSPEPSILSLSEPVLAAPL